MAQGSTSLLRVSGAPRVRFAVSAHHSDVGAAANSGNYDSSNATFVDRRQQSRWRPTSSDSPSFHVALESCKCFWARYSPRRIHTVKCRGTLTSVEETLISTIHGHHSHYAGLRPSQEPVIQPEAIRSWSVRTWIESLQITFSLAEVEFSARNKIKLEPEIDLERERES